MQVLLQLSIEAVQQRHFLVLVLQSGRHWCYHQLQRHLLQLVVLQSLHAASRILSVCAAQHQLL